MANSTSTGCSLDTKPKIVFNKLVFVLFHIIIRQICIGHLIGDLHLDHFNKKRVCPYRYFNLIVISSKFSSKHDKIAEFEKPWKKDLLAVFLRSTNNFYDLLFEKYYCRAPTDYNNPLDIYVFLIKNGMYKTFFGA